MNVADAQFERNEFGRRILLIAGLVLFALASWVAGRQDGLWLAPLGVGLALTAWLGYRLLLLWGLVHFLIQQFLVPSPEPWVLQLACSVLLIAEIASLWFLFRLAASPNESLEEPHNATVFLILTAAVAIGFALLSVLAALWLGESPASFWHAVGRCWLARLLGVLVIAPPLLVVLGPHLERWGLIASSTENAQNPIARETPWTFGEQLETAGLTIAGLLSAYAMTLEVDDGIPNWRWWVVLLMITVWASVRLRLRGGLLVACASALLALVVATTLSAAAYSSVFQGYLLALCTSALLIGVSSNWIRASEDRIRQLMGHLPVVLYSVRLTKQLPEATQLTVTPNPSRDRHAQMFWSFGRVTLVSAGANDVFGCRPEDLMGSLENWKQRIHSSDLEVVQAAFLQLTREERPISFEYRLVGDTVQVQSGRRDGQQTSAVVGDSAVWVRDTLVPHYREDGRLDGWDGVLQNITESRRLAHELRRTTSMLQALIENLPTGVFFVQGPEGRPILVNARARRLLGRREDLAASCSRLSQVFRLHRPDGNEYPPEELPVTKALRDGMTCMADDIVVHRGDGRKVPLVTWAAPVDLEGAGQTGAAVWVLEDLTALQQAELSRRETEARLRVVIETMVEGVVVFDNRRQIIELNQAAKLIFGATLQLGATLTELETMLCGEDGSPILRGQSPIAGVFESRQPVRYLILRVPSSPGESVRSVVVNVVPLPAIHSFSVRPGEARVVATFADVTEHRQAIDALRKAKNRYQNLVDSLPLTVLQFDADLNLTFANPAALGFLGYQREELFIPGFVFSMIHEEHRSNFHKAMKARLKSMLPITVMAKDSSVKSGLAFLQPRTTGDGVDCLIVDMTKQRKLEREMQRAQRLELVGKLAGGTIHDFNNLLAAMIGSASLAQAELDPEHPSHSELQRVLSAGEQASHLAGQLLAFSKNQQVRITRVDLNKTLRQSMNMLQSMMPKPDTVRLDLSEAPLLAAADENALKQVMMNLCLNARDSISEDGVIRIQSGVGALPQPFRGQEDSIPSQWIYFTIEDDGVGMSNDVKEKMFEPFFSTKERGTGLGLAIVRQIIDRHSGFIELESEPDRGSRFRVWLPPLPGD